jgi:hypothetical protein
MKDAEERGVIRGEDVVCEEDGELEGDGEALIDAGGHGELMIDDLRLMIF